MLDTQRLRAREERGSTRRCRYLKGTMERVLWAWRDSKQLMSMLSGLRAQQQARVMRITVAHWHHAVWDIIAMRETGARFAKRAGAGLEASVVMEWRRRTWVSQRGRVLLKNAGRRVLSLAMRGMRVVRDDKTQCPRLQGLVALVGKHSDTVMRCKFLAWRHFISQEREQNEVDAREALRRQIKAGMIFVALRMGCARAAQQRFYADLLKMSRGRRLARVVLGTWQTGACMLALGRIMTVRAEARAEHACFGENHDGAGRSEG